MIIIEVEGQDVCIPPFVIHYTKDEADFITEHWIKSGYEYIVDPLGSDQCLALEYSQMLTAFKIQFCLKFGIVKKKTISYNEYKRGIYNTYLD